MLFFSLSPRFFSVSFSIFSFFLFSPLFFFFFFFFCSPSFFFQFSLVLRLSRAYDRSVPVSASSPSSRKYTRGMQDWPGNGLDMFIDILKCRSPVFGCIVELSGGLAEREKDREYEGERESCAFTPQQSITLYSARRRIIPEI